MSQCNQCCKTPCECMDCPNACTNGVVASDAWEAPPVACPACRPDFASKPNAVTPLSGMSSDHLTGLHRMAENMQRAARQGLITSRAHARWKIAARGLCFLVRAEFDSRTLAALESAR